MGQRGERGGGDPTGTTQWIELLADKMDESAKAVGRLDGKVDNLRTELHTVMASMGERMARQETGASSLRHEVNNLTGALAALPDRMRGLISEHAGECSGRQRGRTPQSIPMGAAPVNGTANGYVIPRWIIWIGIVAGVTIAIAGWVALKLAS
jgi:hypothetical protein